MIPKNITREHVLRAIGEINRIGIREGRESKKFYLEYGGKFFPPKYVISMANKYANGEELGSSEFSGGNETNDFLRALGFSIASPTVTQKIVTAASSRAKKRILRKQHDERCPKCKEIVKAILERIYGEVEENFRFDVGTFPEDF
jgi:hypothetical protein